MLTHLYRHTLFPIAHIFTTSLQPPMMLISLFWFQHCSRLHRLSRSLHQTHTDSSFLPYFISLFFLLYLLFKFHPPTSTHPLWCLYFFPSLPPVPFAVGQQHANYAPQMQIFSYLKRDLQWRRRVCPASQCYTEVGWRWPWRTAE